MKNTWANHLFCLQFVFWAACQQDNFAPSVNSSILDQQALQDDQSPDNRKEKTVAAEPVMTGGGFLHAACQNLTSETTTESYACGIYHESQEKAKGATIVEIVIHSDASQFIPVLQALPDDSPWHVSFSMPEGFQATGDERIDIQFALGEEKYQTKIDSGLPIPSKKPFAFALANPSSVWLNSFNVDPTQLDTNRDSIPDWSLGFGSIGAETLKDGLFYFDNNIRLNSQASPQLPAKLSIDFSFRSLAPGVGPGAEIWVHLIENPNAIGKIFCFLQKQVDGSQTLLVYSKTPTNPRFLHQEIKSLPDELINPAILFDTAERSFRLKLGTDEYGPFTYIPINEPSRDYVILQSRDSTSVFGHVNFAIED